MTNPSGQVGEVRGHTPTQQQISLAQFADNCEASGFKPSHYYRLLPQIIDARAAIARAESATP